ncbi:hypothetical protein [Actinomadura formosensis]|uniref:hypothetical protein n=1 Tax=Actinomadura formosensis TaxID=60706 RepID=UPI003D933294
MADPMMQLDPQGKAPILSYNVAEPTSYTGRNGIALELPGASQDWFVEAALDEVEQGRVPIEELANVTPAQVAEALRTGDERIFPGIKNPAATHSGLFHAQNAVQRSGGLLDTETTSVLGQGLRDRAVRPDLHDFVTQEAPQAPAPTPTPVPHVEAAAAAPAERTNLPLAVRGSVLAEAALADRPLTPKFTDLDIEHVAERLRKGRRLNVYRSMWGEYNYGFLPEPKVRHPQIVLIETYRMSSFLGQYGAGRTLKTFSLLPGEKTTISVKTFRKSEQAAKSASSVLDSFTKESADDFETSVQQEQSDKQAEQESFEYHAEAEASASWGWGSAKVSGGVKGGTASQREQFAKNVSNALNKHSAKASSKRDVQVETSNEVRQEEGEETSITRQLENINVGRTLNFVFRQMNQEHITLLHLVDVRVAYWTGQAESVEEVPLSKLAVLLEKYVKPAKHKELTDMIIEQLSTVLDHRDEVVNPPFIEKKSLSATDFYWRVRKDMTSTYQDETGNKFTVPGVIVAANKIVMRTEGVIVDALLGQGNALDDYSKGLQEAAVKQRELANAAAQARLDQEALAREIVKNKDNDKAKIFRQVFADSVALPGKISVSAADNGAVTVSSTADGAEAPA